MARGDPCESPDAEGAHNDGQLIRFSMTARLSGSTTLSVIELETRRSVSFSVSV